MALTTGTIHEMINNKDIVIVSGGISVGDYDFVAHSLRDLEVEEIFYKVNQKPGKPLFYGKKGKCNIFALPGNPAAALLCYYEYALLLTRILSGQTNGNLEKRTLRSEIDYEKKGERAHFLKAIAKNGSVEILQGQNSSMLHTFAHANAFVYIPHHKNGIKKREEVEVHMIPNC